MPREDWESLGCSMKESLSSSSTPRSGEVEEEEELEALLARCIRRERDMLAVFARTRGPVKEVSRVLSVLPREPRRVQSRCFPGVSKLLREGCIQYLCGW